ncbi:MAG: type II toxin-antitoxin system VapC family toxin, partial [Methanobacteriaceae archaeon]
IFVDSSFLIGLFIEKDYWNKTATELLTKLPKERVICFSVLSEVITLVGQKSDTETSKNVYDYLTDNYQIFDETQIKNAYDKIIDTCVKNRGKLSFTDSAIVEVMKELNIKEIVSFDKDFDKQECIVRIY